MILRFSVRIFLIFVLASCAGPGYYLQAMSGQWKLMHARRDVQSILDDPETSSQLAAKLETAGSIKIFALDTLGLPGNKSYSSYVEVDGDALLWNVVATEEFSLQAKKWCFPVAGCVPYRGFFKQQKAIDFAARLKAKGMDVSVSPATAYSSLGWFNDPLLSTMFSGSDTRLAAYLFHELAHQRLYIKGDGLFNEGYASFVEETGVKTWLESSQRNEDFENWQQLQNVSRDFTRLIGQVRAELTRLYRSNEPEAAMRKQKTEILRSVQTSWEQLSSTKWQGKRYYTSWFEKPLNNARLALYNTYEGSYCAFQRLWEQSGSNWQEFHQLAEQKSKLQKQQRNEWLMQTCPTIAH